jgi:hypothetical protein
VCSITGEGSQSTGPALQGGASASISRTVAIDGSGAGTCVIEYYERLALGSSQNPGASLDSYLSGDLGDQSIPIKVSPNSMAPGFSQGLQAVTGTDHTWNISWTGPATVTVPDVCSASPTSAAQTLTLKWNKVATGSSEETITPSVTVTNPTHRTLDVSVTVNVYDSGDNLLGTLSGTATVNGNQTTTVALLTAGPPQSSSLTVTSVVNVYETATATFTDPADSTFTFTDGPITYPTAPATVSPSTTGGTSYDNQATLGTTECMSSSATASDCSSLSKLTLSASVTNLSNTTTDTFLYDGSPYSGSAVPGPILWTSGLLSDADTLPDSGSVTFSKAVQTQQYDLTDGGTLADFATLTGSDSNLLLNSSSLIAPVTVSAIVNLTITNTATGADSSSTPFVFTIYSNYGASNQQAVQTVTITGSGSSTEQLGPGTYTVVETVPSDWNLTSSNTQAVTLTASSAATCAAGVSFTNSEWQNLSITNTVADNFSDSYSWPAPVKALTGSSVVQGSGAVTFSYSVTEGAPTLNAGNWEVDGSYTLTNPNSGDMPVTVTIIDSDGVACSGSGASVTVPANGSTGKINYACMYTPFNLPGSGATITVTADESSYPPLTSASSPATSIPAVTVNPANSSITLYDSFNGGSQRKLGTITAPGLSVTGLGSGVTDKISSSQVVFNYSDTTPNPSSTPGTCKSYSNTATGSNTVTATACNNNTGALTMGFWQNNNGQGIITGQAASGPCPSAAWLESLEPFNHQYNPTGLVATTTYTCKQTAAWVYNIIKAANASGSSMAAMLDAQMLATSLDVYFSTSGYFYWNTSSGLVWSAAVPSGVTTYYSAGGNKIAAYDGNISISNGGLGSVKINLQQICAMKDGSSGGTCSGTNENASSAFGGAASMTVLQLLSWQNTGTWTNPATSVNKPVFYNSGSTIYWYQNVKSEQQFAKDTFDAINNRVAAIQP